jgi:hypothetical protein
MKPRKAKEQVTVIFRLLGRAKHQTEHEGRARCDLLIEPMMRLEAQCYDASNASPAGENSGRAIPTAASASQLEPCAGRAQRRRYSNSGIKLMCAVIVAFLLSGCAAHRPCPGPNPQTRKSSGGQVEGKLPAQALDSASTARGDSPRNMACCTSGICERQGHHR